MTDRDKQQDQPRNREFWGAFLTEAPVSASVNPSTVSVEKEEAAFVPVTSSSTKRPQRPCSIPKSSNWLHRGLAKVKDIYHQVTDVFDVFLGESGYLPQTLIGKYVRHQQQKCCQIVGQHKETLVTLGIVGLLALGSLGVVYMKDAQQKALESLPGYEGPCYVSRAQMAHLTHASLGQKEVFQALALIQENWPAFIPSPWHGPYAMPHWAYPEISAKYLVHEIQKVRQQLAQETGFSLMAQGVDVPTVGKILTDMMHIADGVYQEVGDRPVPLMSYFEYGYRHSTMPLMGDDLSLACRREQTAYYLNELQHETERLKKQELLMSQERKEGEKHDRRTTNTISANNTYRGQTGQGR